MHHFLAYFGKKYIYMSCNFAFIYVLLGLWDIIGANFNNKSRQPTSKYVRYYGHYCFLYYQVVAGYRVNSIYFIYLKIHKSLTICPRIKSFTVLRNKKKYLESCALRAQGTMATSGRK